MVGEFAGNRANPANDEGARCWHDWRRTGRQTRSNLGLPNRLFDRRPVAHGPPSFWLLDDRCLGLGRNLCEFSGGPAFWQNAVRDNRDLTFYIVFFVGCPVMTALEATDVITVIVMMIIQVTVTLGAAFYPEHGFTTSVISSLFNRLNQCRHYGKGLVLTEFCLTDIVVPALKPR